MPSIFRYLITLLLTSAILFDAPAVAPKFWHTLGYGAAGGGIVGFMRVLEHYRKYYEKGEPQKQNQLIKPSVEYYTVLILQNAIVGGTASLIFINCRQPSANDGAPYSTALYGILFSWLLGPIPTHT